MYFIKPNHCAIVTDEGPDVHGKISGQIAPYGICALWEPNKEEIRSASTSAGKSDESTTNVSATFSCEICNSAFNSREELKQHTIQEHAAMHQKDITNSLDTMAALFIVFVAPLMYQLSLSF